MNFIFDKFFEFYLRLISFFFNLFGKSFIYDFNDFKPNNTKNWYEDQEIFIKESLRFIKENKKIIAYVEWEEKFFNEVCIFVLALCLFDDTFLILQELYNFFFVDLREFFFTAINQSISYYNQNKYFLVVLLFFMYFFNILTITITSYLFGVRGVFVVSTFSIFFFWCIQLYFINNFFLDSMEITLELKFWQYIAGTYLFNFNLKFDFITYCFLFLTTSIGLCANVYSYNYFKNEPHTDRFMLMINWFIISMALLVLSDNALLLFLGWELIGLTSFLLINFWTVRRGTLKSAVKAFTFNKISDVFLLFFLIILSQLTGSFLLTDWFTFYLLSENYTIVSLFTPTIFLILASSIKSAQLFGHLWLPDSMEAPIPASALIHSATLVSAGVYLLLRFNWLFKITNLFFFLVCLGAITAFYGAIVSAAQTDCKKLLAYSTISHCGFLFVTLGLNNVYLTITYLYLHGFFKALTFFCVGNLVKVSKNYQDTRKMGHLFSVLPIESILLVVSAVNLGALPYTVGYFYKSLFQQILINNTVFLIALPFIFIGMLCSVIYVFRLIFYSLFDIQKNNEINFHFFFVKKLEDEEYSSTTLLGVIFIFLLIFFSVYVYLFYFLFLKNFVFFNSTCNVEYLEIIQTFKQNHLVYYYSFYAFFIAICFLIFRVQCRVEFSYLKKNYINYFIFLFLFSIQFVIFFIAVFL